MMVLIIPISFGLGLFLIGIVILHPIFVVFRKNRDSILENDNTQKSRENGNTLSPKQHESHSND